MDEIKYLLLGYAVITVFSVGFLLGAFWCYYKLCDCNCGLRDEEDHL